MVALLVSGFRERIMEFPRFSGQFT
jgi:hypothetical protein